MALSSCGCIAGEHIARGHALALEQMRERAVNAEERVAAQDVELDEVVEMLVTAASDIENAHRRERAANSMADAFIRQVRDLRETADESQRIIRGYKAEEGVVQFLYEREHELVAKVRALHAAHAAELSAVRAAHATKIANGNEQNKARVDVINSMLSRAQKAEATVLVITGQLRVARECNLIANRRSNELESAMRFAPAPPAAAEEEEEAEEMSPIPELAFDPWLPLVGPLGEEESVFSLRDDDANGVRDDANGVPRWCNWRRHDAAEPADNRLNRRPARSAHARLASLTSSF